MPGAASVFRLEEDVSQKQREMLADMTVTQEEIAAKL